MNRFGAFAIHLGISLVIFAVLAYLVLYHWYPDFFFASDGGWQGMRIIAFVDLVLGPVLTLVVFNRNKPPGELRRDLSIIATIQAVCLTGGVYVVYSERPLALVYVDGQFYSMSAGDYREAGVTVPDLGSYPGNAPKRVVVELPEDPTEQSAVRSDAYSQDLPLRALTDLYGPMTYEKLGVSSDAVRAGYLAQKNPEKVREWLEAHGGELDDYAFFPFATRYGYTFLGVSRQRRELVGMLNVSRLAEGWS